MMSRRKPEKEPKQNENREKLINRFSEMEEQAGEFMGDEKNSNMILKIGGVVLVVILILGWIL